MNACIRSRGVKHVVALLGCASLLLVFAVPFAAAQGSATFKGEIADEHLNCLQTPMKVSQDIKDKTSRVLYYAHFVKPPSKYVLYAGAKNVQISGTLDAATKSIHVKEIKALS